MIGHAAYPPYIALGAFPSIIDNKFWTAIGACLRMAAEVLLVGKADASPKVMMFLYSLCNKVSLSTAIQPSATREPVYADNPDSLTNLGAPIGGKKCRKSKSSTRDVTFFTSFFVPSARTIELFLVRANVTFFADVSTALT